MSLNSCHSKTMASLDYRIPWITESLQPFATAAVMGVMVAAVILLSCYLQKVSIQINF